jgi:DNA-binding transcriptional MerR regulator
MAQHEPIRKRAAASGSEIPDKLYFRIGEVAKLCDVPAYVLRFWESEFPQLKPNKGGTGQRLYRRRDVETALRVKSLLYDQGFTIPGARQLLKTEQRSKEPMLLPGIDNGMDPERLKKIRKELSDLLALLSKPAAKPAGKAVHPIRPTKTAARPPVRPAPRPEPAVHRLFDTTSNPEA